VLYAFPTYRATAAGCSACKSCIYPLPGVEIFVVIAACQRLCGPPSPFLRPDGDHPGSSNTIVNLSVQALIHRTVMNELKVVHSWSLNPNEGLHCVSVHHAPCSKSLSGHRSCSSVPLIRRYLIAFNKVGNQITECPVRVLCDGNTWVAFVPLHRL
jgi:hypothetical protein